MPKPNEQLVFDFHAESLRDDLVEKAMRLWLLWNQGHLVGNTYEAQQEMDTRFGELSVPLLEFKRIGVLP